MASRVCSIRVACEGLEISGKGLSHCRLCSFADRLLPSHSCRVDLSFKMGKVHGSLARAGKVKSQCPKVDKQEKPKQPKGRAKKRLLYNRWVVSCASCGTYSYADGIFPHCRRFVNVVLGPSGKRRSNAQGVSTQGITSLPHLAAA